MCKQFKVLLIAILTLTINSHLFSDENNEISGNIKSPHTQKEFGQVPRSEAMNVPRSVPHPYSYVLSASYTLWKSYQQGMNVAASNVPATSVAGLGPGNVLRPNNPPQSGFKVAAFMQTDYDDWQAGLDYTWFNNQNSLSNRNYVIDNIYMTPWVNFDIIDLTEAKSGFSNQFNRLELLLKRAIAFSPLYTFTPFSAVIGAWEDQHFKMQLNTQTLGDIDVQTFDLDQYWYSFGVCGGSKIAYELVNYLSFFLKGSAALNFAKHQITQKHWQAEDDSSPKSILVNQTSNYWNVEPMLDGSIGITIDTTFNEIMWLLDIAWELQTWFSHNGFTSARSNSGINGNYSMQGLTITGKVCF